MSAPTVAPAPPRPLHPHLTVRLAALLERHHLSGLLPALLAILGPLTHPTKVHGGQGATVSVDVVRSLSRVLRVHPSLVDDVLDAVSPHLVLPDKRVVNVRPSEHSGTGVIGKRPRGDVGLTERELQVLRGMASGSPNAQIGRDLYLSEDTVKTHARRLFRKIGARDRAQAVYLGCRLGLLPLTAEGDVDPLEVAS